MKKKQELQTLRPKTLKELSSELKETREQLASARLDLPVGRLKDRTMVRKLRQKIARILTVYREKELENV